MRATCSKTWGGGGFSARKLSFRWSRKKGTLPGIARPALRLDRRSINSYSYVPYIAILSAADALGEIGGKEAMGLLIKLTKDKSAYVRTAAANALRRVSRVRFSG